jgi:hypothetical protein
MDDFFIDMDYSCITYGQHNFVVLLIVSLASFILQKWN